MPVSERHAEHVLGSTSGTMNRVGLSSTTRVADLTPTAAWSRRVRWIGGLIQAAFAAFWLVRGSAVIGGSAAGVLIAVFGVIVIGVFSYATAAMPVVAAAVTITGRTIAGSHDLAGVRRAEQGRAGTAAVSVSAGAQR